MNQVNLWILEDTPGLAYAVQSPSASLNGVWQSNAVTAFDANTIWSTSINPAPGADSGFYRVNAAPSPATSPPWPPQ